MREEDMALKPSRPPEREERRNGDEHRRHGRKEAVGDSTEHERPWHRKPTPARSYFDMEDVNDQLLKPCMTRRVYEESSRYIRDFALHLGVPHHMIAVPVPFKVSRLAMYWALMQTALDQSLMASGGNEAGDDAYELKRRLYKGLVEELEDEITADTLLGEQSKANLGFPSTMPMLRN